jgi:glycosyltransferase involved in cell wall biosynthesis
MSLAVVILTHNEEIHLARALRSIEACADEVFVIDSFSSDRTVEIARVHRAIVLQNRFINQARQFQWALDNAPITADWVMRLDADEVISLDLATKIPGKLVSLPADVVGINLKRRHIFLGRWIRHGGRYPLVMLRIWRRGNGRIEDRWMDEHMIVWGGRTVTLDGGFSDHNLNNLGFFTDKHNNYATREAIEVLNRRLHLFRRETTLSHDNSSRQASIKRFLKEAVYNRVPFQISATAYFAYRYFFQFGFLDGSEGLIYHFLQAFWYRFLVGAKVLELRRAIAHLSDRDQIRSELTRLTGLKIE